VVNELGVAPCEFFSSIIMCGFVSWCVPFGGGGGLHILMYTIDQKERERSVVIF
jgi:hypothetical protein